MLKLAPGEAFGEYQIETRLGRGGMGTVYLVTHRRLERKVALKVIARDLAEDEDFRARFLRESQLAASLDHPNVIPIYDAGEIDGVLYLAMRYVSGPSLRERIKERGRLTPKETLQIAEQIGGALDAAHRSGLVHRDVKPANILLGEPGDHAYLCDFGLAKRTSSRGTTETGSFLGSVDYCAPEQIQGRPVDGRADVYSLGGVLYHCLAGQPPFARETDFAVLHAHLADPRPPLSDVRTDLPRGLDTVLATAMAKSPDDRYPSAGELAAAFGAALGETEGASADATRAAPITAAPDSPESDTEAAATIPAGTPRRPHRTRPLWIAAALALLALLAVVAALVVATGGSDGGSTNTAEDARLGAFVDRVENVLDQSASGRTEIAAALSAGFKCSISPGEAGRRIASVADNRQSILLQIGTLATPTPQADEVITRLQKALQQSIEADRHYRDGFFALPSNARCPLPRNPSFVLAAASDAQATRAKRRFVAIFNPLSARFHRRSWSANEF